MKRALNRAWRRALGAATWPLAVTSRTFGRRPASPPRRVLVMRFGLMGDGVLLVPALRDLRDRLDRAHREARTGARATIDVLVTPLQRPILARLVADGVIDGLVDWTAGDLTELHRARHLQAWRDAMSTIRTLRARRHDLAVSCYGHLGSAIAVLAGIPRRAGLASEAFPGTLTHGAPSHRYASKWHEAAHDLAAVRAALPFDDDPDPPPGMAPDPTAGGRHRLPVRDDEGDAARARFGVPAGTRLVAVHPGATNGSAKRWPVASWATVAAHLAADGTAVAIVGGPEDRALGREIMSRIAPLAVEGSPAARDGGVPVGARIHLAPPAADRPPSLVGKGGGGLGPSGELGPSVPGAGAIHDLTGRTTIDDLVGILAAADAVVTGDSGPLHLAVALGRPVVAIHGPTDPDVCGPVTGAGPRVAIVEVDLPCRPCYSLARMADCPLGHALCQHLVTPHDVLAAVAQVTGDHAAPVTRRARGEAPTPNSSPAPAGEGSRLPSHLAALVRGGHDHDGHDHDHPHAGTP